MVLRLQHHRLRRLSEEGEEVRSFRQPFCAVRDGYKVTTAGEQGEVGNVMGADK